MRNDSTERRIWHIFWYKKVKRDGFACSAQGERTDGKDKKSGGSSLVLKRRGKCTGRGEDAQTEKTGHGDAGITDLEDNKNIGGSPDGGQIRRGKDTKLGGFTAVSV